MTARVEEQANARVQAMMEEVTGKAAGVLEDQRRRMVGRCRFDLHLTPD